MRKLLILYAILSFCLSTVSALQISSPMLDGARSTNVVSTLTVTNDGTSVVTGLQLSSSADSKYKITFENVPPSIAPGSSAVITIKGFIPADFGSSKLNIGTVTAKIAAPAQNTSQNITTNTSSMNLSNVFGTHNFTPSNQSPQQVTLPVGMSATNDCGNNTPDLSDPFIGQWHTGSCDLTSDIEVNQPFVGQVDAGWARIHSSKLNDYWVNAVSVDCNGQSFFPPQNWLYGGKIHTGPGLCDNNVELPSGDSGWVGFYSNPNAEGQLILVIAYDKCGGSPQSVPANGIVLGKVSTGPNKCDGSPEAFSYTGVSLDAGSMYVVYLPTPITPANYLPIGVFENLNITGFSGWAYDNNTPATMVQIFVDGTFWKEMQATVPRQDLVTAGLIPNPNHGFSYQFTQSDLTSLNTAVNHSFSVIAINSPTGNNPVLNGSPKILAAFQVNATNNSSNNSSNGNSSASTSASAPIYMQAKNELSIDRVKITCDKTTSIEDGTVVSDISPGQTCIMTIKVRNTGSTRIEDITIEVDPKNSDISGDTVDISSLDAGDTEEKTLELKVSDGADDGSVKVSVAVDGTNENNVKQSDALEFTMKVERLKHDLQISKIAINPTQAKVCEVSRVDIAVTVANKGQRDEKRAAVELSVPALSFTKKITGIVIDKDEEQKVTFSVPITSASPTGTFTVNIKSFFETNGQSGTKTASMVLVKCPQPAPQTNDDQLSGPVVTPPPHVDDVVVVAPPRDEPEKNWFDSAWFTIALVFANLVALSVLGIMGYMFFFKKPEDPLAEQFEDDKPLEEINLKDYY